MTANIKDLNLIDKPRLDSVYLGVCKILNSIEKYEEIKENNIIFYTKSVNDLNSLKNIVKRVYYKFKFAPPVFCDYINCKQKYFNKKISVLILDTIYRTAALYDFDGYKNFSDFNLIIMVLSHLLKNFI